MRKTSGNPDDGDTRVEGERLTAHRRQVTVLFADMVSYTELIETLGEEATYLLMRRVHRDLGAAVHAHGGTVKEWTGDGLVALFGAPTAVEDAPVRACRAALEIQDRMHAIAAEVETQHGQSLGFRVGVHSGPLVIATGSGSDPTSIQALGDTANVAARLEGAAATGTILISAATRAAVDGYVDVAYAGALELKGKSEPQPAYRLLGIRRTTRFDISRARGLSSFVGRERDLETLRTAWNEALEGGLAAVDVLGDAGIGKSRLIHEFMWRIGDDAFRSLTCHCTADGQATPFQPFIECVRVLFQVQGDVQAQEIERRIERDIDALGLSVRHTLPYVLNLLGLQPDRAELKERASETVGIRTRQAILRLLRAHCRIEPTILLVEDVQWIDSASQDLLRRIATDPQVSGLLIVTTRRPTRGSPWLDAHGVTPLNLAPLPQDSTTALLTNRLGTDNVTSDTADTIARKAEGNPLFAEELSNFFQSARHAQLDRQAAQSTLDRAWVSISLDNLLMQRVDRLDRPARAVLEAAAVTGRRFSARLVDHVLDGAGDTAEHLATLERAELIRRTDEPGTYVFKHGLIRDTVYQSMLTARRAELHAGVAHIMEDSYADRPGEVADTLAHHYTRAGRREKAVRFLGLAGGNSLRVYALDEAEDRFQAVLAMVAEQPDLTEGELLADVVLGQARIFYFKSDFANLIDLVETYLPRIEALGDKGTLSRFLFETGYAHVFAARPEIGRPALERAMSLAEESGDEQAVGYSAMGLVWYYTHWAPPSEQRQDKATTLGERAVEIGRRTGDVWLTSKATLALAVDAHTWGRVKEAGRRDQQLFDLSREMDDPRPKTMGLWRSGMLRALTGDPMTGAEFADQALNLSLSPVDRLYARCTKAIAYVLAGRGEDAFDMLASVRTTFERGSIRMTGYILVELPYGLALVMNGDWSAGIRHIKQNAKEYQKLGLPFAQAWSHYYLGEIYRQTAASKARPSPRAMVRNLGFVLFRAPLAARLADRHLRTAEKHFRDLDAPANLAMTLCGLGLLASTQQQPVLARARLKDAYEIAAAQEMSALRSHLSAKLDEL
jgi:class 3 adenylate cyclase